MSEPNRCPKCGVELSTGALAGLCPTCLLAAGLESDAGQEHPGGGGSGAPTSPLGAGFVPPEPAWLAAHFPQLEILELLGRGGMGAVYKARQPRLDRLVALKIIRPASNDDPSFAERFNREARMLARLSHPNIVGVYDFGSVDISLREMNPHAEREDYTEIYYFLMEYVDGANLRELMRSGELTPEQALAIVPQICEALQFAHDDGVIHRDIKPENILLDKKGRVKIADFGLAKLAAHSPEQFTLTATHQVMGTPRYMAPEQMEGSHAVDHRADIFSLGVVFYEMLTGEVPAGHFEPPSKKVEIDVRLDEVVLRAMAREPERRYQHASDVKSDLESISTRHRPADALPPTPSPATTGDQTPKKLARRQVRWPAIGLIFSAGFNLFLILFYLLGTLADWEERGWDAAWQETLELGPILLTTMVLSMPISVFMIVAAVRMMNVGSYRLAVAAAILALLPISLTVVFGLPIGIWALFVLSRPEVKRGFVRRQQRAVREQTPADTSENSSLSREPMPLRQKPRGTLGQAWDDWWAQRDRWVTNSAQVVLGLVFLLCLITYLNPSRAVDKLPDKGSKLLHHTVEIGAPFSPWFRYEAHAEGQPGYYWEINWLSWSSAIMLLGFLAWCVAWQIEKAKAKTTGKKLRWWHGSPYFGIAIWAVGTLIIVVRFGIYVPLSLE